MHKQSFSIRLAGRCIAGVFLFLALAQAFADSPTTQGSPQSPKQVFKIFLFELRKGDARDLPDACSARQADSQALLRDFQSVATAIGELRDAAGKKFGSDEVESVIPDMFSSADVDDMTETDTGDHAELHGDDTVPLVKSADGQWKLDIDALRHGPDIPANVHFMAELAQALHRTAADINSGKLDSAGAAAEAIQAREQAIDQDAPATQPATQS